jgi:hypothetical protein
MALVIDAPLLLEDLTDDQLARPLETMASFADETELGSPAPDIPGAEPDADEEENDFYDEEFDNLQYDVDAEDDLDGREGDEFGEGDDEDAFGEDDFDEFDDQEDIAGDDDF